MGCSIWLLLTTISFVLQGGPKDDKGLLCRDLILNSDRIRIVVRVGTFIEELWQDCYCSSKLMLLSLILVNVHFGQVHICPGLVINFKQQT